MLATYHNHSTWSDGKAGVADIVAAAARMRIGEVGISDHWVLHPRGTQYRWAMQTDRLADYVAEIRSLRERAKPQAAVRLGLEVDWHDPSLAPDHAQRLKDVLEQYPFDYIIGSVHEIQLPWRHESFMIDGSPAAWEQLTASQIDDVHRRYWAQMKTLASSGVFDIVAHIDLPKKFAFYPSIELTKEIHAALDAIAAATTPAGNQLVVEVNTAGWHKPCEDAYPTLDILRECRRRDIPSTINADAHHPDHLLRDFDRAASRLAEAGYAEIARFDQRAARFESLADALTPQR